MTSHVGALDLPITAGPTGSRLADPAVRGLADFFCFSLRQDLNAKLTALLGMSADACPTANVYWWDPDTHFVWESLPALYLWWPGTSRVFQKTMVYADRERELSGMYVFEETLAPAGLRARSGLLAAVDASLSKASQRGRYASHTPAIAGAYAGQSVAKALGLVSWEYLGGQQGKMIAQMPESSANPGGAAEGHRKRGYPALSFRVLVNERIGADETDSTMSDADATFTIRHADDPQDPIDVLERYAHAPIGTRDE